MSRRQFLVASLGLAVSPQSKEPWEDEFSRLLSEGADYIEPPRGEAIPAYSHTRHGSLPPLFSGSTGRELFLTFDDGPLHCTSRILDLLAQWNHKATFFVIGRNMLNPQLRKLAVKALREGHEIGNHSYSHPDFANISSRQALKEIWATHRIIAEVVEEAGVDPDQQDLYFRFPYGSDGNRSNRGAIRSFLAELDYGTAWWDLDTNDWQMELAWFPRSPARVIGALKSARPRDVVLLHDRERTARYLPEMLRTLAEAQLVSVPLADFDYGSGTYLLGDPVADNRGPMSSAQPPGLEKAVEAIFNSLILK